MVVDKLETNKNILLLFLKTIVTSCKCMQTKKILIMNIFQYLNKLKSLKVAQVKDEMDDNEDDGCDFMCDVLMLCCV